MDRHEQVRLDLGAYVLGALEPEEAAVLEAHLAGCPACRAELASLESLPALLDAVPVERAQSLARGVAYDAGLSPEPATPPRALLARVGRRRRTQRIAWGAGLAAAAAAFFAAGIALGPVLGPTLGLVPGAGAQPAPSSVPSPTASAPAGANVTLASAEGARVDVAMVRKAWGTELDLTCRDMPAGSVFSVWVVSEDGSAQQAASWSSGGYQGRAVLRGATSLQLGSIRSVEIREAERTIASASVS